MRSQNLWNYNTMIKLGHRPVFLQKIKLGHLLVLLQKVCSWKGGAGLMCWPKWNISCLERLRLIPQCGIHTLRNVNCTTSPIQVQLWLLFLFLQSVIWQSSVFEARLCLIPHTGRVCNGHCASVQLYNCTMHLSLFWFCKVLFDEDPVWFGIVDSTRIM